MEVYKEHINTNEESGTTGMKGEGGGGGGGGALFKIHVTCKMYYPLSIVIKLVEN